MQAGDGVNYGYGHTLEAGKEEMTRRDIERGVYEGGDEFVEGAVALLHGEEACLAENGSGVRANIELGYASAQPGEQPDSDRLRKETEHRKSARLAVEQRTRSYN